MKRKTPVDIVIFGGNGDLARRKLLPSLYALSLAGLLLPADRIIGCSRTKLTDEAYRQFVRDSLALFSGRKELDKARWETFSSQLFYHQVEVAEVETYEGLKVRLEAETGRTRIIYLSIIPALFGQIASNLAANGLVQKNTRVVMEKPIGHDLISSRLLNNEIAAVFPEENIYRIDHYLGKETVQNLLALRFGNILFESLWNAAKIDHVQITVAETVGVEGRWSYYDGAGAMRDMVQNHLLQVLCLLAMEPPASLSPDAVRDEKVKVLKALRPIRSEADIRDKTVRGLYTRGLSEGQTVPGYLEEEGGNPESETESFVALRVDIDNWRWAGVPFYLRTGKRLPARYSEVVVQFREVPHSIFSEEQGSLVPNRIIVQLQPDQGIGMSIMGKTPGMTEEMQLRPVHLNLGEKVNQPPGSAQESYERLLLDVIRGNNTLFVRRDEVETAWAWADDILKGWKRYHIKADTYPAGTWGPTSSVALVVRDDRRWRE